MTRGTTSFKELKFTCNFIWKDSTPEITLVLNIPTLDIFVFEEGGLWSNITPSSGTVHSFHNTNDGEVVLADERNRLGVGDFSVRMVCQLSSSSDGRKGIVVKFVILLFPASATELSDTPESRFAGWPGIKLYEGTFPVIPKPTVPWQCPIVPFLRLLTVLSPDTTWPYVEMSPEPEGKITRYFLLDNFSFCPKSPILHASHS